MGRDGGIVGGGVYVQGHFNPLSPHGERRTTSFIENHRKSHFNPLSPHGERPDLNIRKMHAEAISIHSPRMGRDKTRRRAQKEAAEFQSTLPAWGETRSAKDFPRLGGFQSTLPAWGETSAGRCAGHGQGISIHSPRMGRDPPGYRG